MLRERILPSGIGHTTNCFIQVEGSENGESYLISEDSADRKNVKSGKNVYHNNQPNQLANIIALVSFPTSSFVVHWLTRRFFFGSRLLAYRQMSFIT